MAGPEAVYRPQTILDVLRLPIIGKLLKHRRGRLFLQLPLVVGAALLVYDGLTGVQTASRNLATVSVWVHYRGFVILALLLVGNLFCMGCPFTLPRTLARKWSKSGRRFPKVLRNKWLAIGGLFLIFWLYEAMDWWASPWLTAWVIIAYLVGSFALEMIFTESAFCKYVCPLGTFNFVYSMVSPTQITAREPNLCKTCVGKECLNGSYSPQPVIRIDEIKDGVAVRQHENNAQGVLGCGTLLFVPQIKSNLDCTLCLDCARACPHDNVALTIRSPLKELQNSGLPKRWDVAFLLVALAFMGITNAFGMVPPVYALLENVARATGIYVEWILLLIIFLIGNIIVPAAAAIGTAWVACLVTGTRRYRHALRDTFVAFAPAFVPIGAGIWAAHYGFHFVIGALTIVPVFQFFLIDHGILLLGNMPNWSLGGVISAQDFSVIQVVLLLGGYLVSMLVSRRIAVRRYGTRQAQQAWLPYAILFLLIMLAALAIFGQPMEMRAGLELN
ncbi:MAG: hypothetical protein OHK0023_20700 [Anaerolineae bacterium]